MDLRSILKHNTWLVVFIAIAISFVFPKPGLWIGPLVAYMLMVLMYLSCIDISGKQIVGQLSNWKKNLVVLIIIHLLSPLIVFLLRPWLSADIFVGLILAAAMPSGMSVVFLSCMYCERKGHKNRVFTFFLNVFSKFFPVSRNVAPKALVITTISNLLSPISVALVVLLFAGTLVDINIWPISLTIIRLVFIPLVFAKFLTSDKLKNKFKNYSGEISLVLLFLIMLGVISPLKSVIIANWQLSLALSALIFCLILINFLVGWFLGNNREDKITYGITASYKNFTLASVVALSVLNPLAALPAIVYAVINNLFLIPLQLIFLREKR